MYELAFIVIGLLLSLIPTWFTRKRRLKTHWCAIRAEMAQCKEKAETLLKDNIQSPLYRLPLIAYQTSYPVLLADGAVDENEVLALGNYFSQVQDINRGLDNSAEANMSGGSHKLKDEFDRNRLKAGKLIKDQNGEASLHKKAKEIVDKKIALRWYQYTKCA